MNIEKSKDFFRYLFKHHTYKQIQDLDFKTKEVFATFDKQVSRASALQALWKNYPKNVVLSTIKRNISISHKKPHHELTFNPVFGDGGSYFARQVPLFTLLMEYGAIHNKMKSPFLSFYKSDNFVFFSMSNTRPGTPQEFIDKAIPAIFALFKQIASEDAQRYPFLNEPGYAPEGKWEDWLARFLHQVKLHTTNPEARGKFNTQINVFNPSSENEKAFWEKILLQMQNLEQEVSLDSKNTVKFALNAPNQVKKSAIL